MPSFTLLTLNSFGLPFFLGWRRMHTLAEELNQRQDTVICLQEIQQESYISVLRKQLTEYPYQCYKQYLFAPMGGLVTASKQPFVSYEFLPFPNRGKWWSIGFADWALRKGVLVTTFDVEGSADNCSEYTYSCELFGVLEQGQHACQDSKRSGTVSCGAGESSITRMPWL